MKRSKLKTEVKITRDTPSFSLHVNSKLSKSSEIDHPFLIKPPSKNFFKPSFRKIVEMHLLSPTLHHLARV